MPSSKHSQTKSIKSAGGKAKSANSTPRQSTTSLDKVLLKPPKDGPLSKTSDSGSKSSQKRSLLSLDKISFHKSISLTSKRSKSLFSIKEQPSTTQNDLPKSIHEDSPSNSLEESSDEMGEIHENPSEDEYSLGEESIRSRSVHSISKSAPSVSNLSVNKSVHSAGTLSIARSAQSASGSARQEPSVSGKTGVNAVSRSKKKGQPEEIVPLEGLYSLEEIYFGRPSERELSLDKKVAALHQNIMNFKGFLYSQLYGRLRVSEDLLNMEEHNFTISYDRYNTSTQFLVKCKVRRKPIYDFNSILFTDLVDSCCKFLNQYKFCDAVLYFPIGKPKDIGIKEYFYAALYVSEMETYWSMLREDIFKSSERHDGRIASRFHSQASVFKTLENDLRKAEKENITSFKFLSNPTDALFVQPSSKKGKYEDPLSASIVRHNNLPLMGFKCNRAPYSLEDAVWLLEYMRTSFLRTPNSSKVYICLSLGREFKFSRHRNVYSYYEIPHVKPPAT